MGSIISFNINKTEESAVHRAMEDVGYSGSMRSFLKALALFAVHNNIAQAYLEDLADKTTTTESEVKENENI